MYTKKYVTRNEIKDEEEGSLPSEVVELHNVYRYTSENCSLHYE